ncbi:hypothetical protein [Chengkuizengella axinellae]|uniref:DUF2642 domain-containing protein n=1 Tax=Chengkuizengella axinellae TaxID=3064388 RepID=A0ABT9J2Z7_9BACL|nr:hypothetical protein [Chengkuizengella sp. 2205SS18-9]MDP5275996.1 hypothetical protein [Chengkuizengella sp. 2205SS18-9]
MGHFDKTICDCCVCPMQCVLEQLVGEEVDIRTISLESDIVGTLMAVDSFIATLDLNNSGELAYISVSEVCYVEVLVPFTIKLKDIRKDKGECSCIEDPVTNLAKSMIGEMKEIIVCNSQQTVGDEGQNGRIVNVGEGIVLLFIESAKKGDKLSAISSCKIEIIAPPFSI